MTLVTPCTVLVLDEDRDVVDLIAASLVPRGYYVVDGRSPTIALNLLRTIVAEVLLVDLPQVDGELGGLIAAARAAGRAPWPQVVVTGLAGERDTHPYVHLVKPFSDLALVEAIEGECGPPPGVSRPGARV